MDDRDIINLYFVRDERAVEATRERYGSYCLTVARNILGDSRDCEECLSDALWQVWNSVPPQHPLSLRAYAARVTRNLALSRLRARTADRRGGGQAELALDELAECVSGLPGPEDELAQQAVVDALNTFLGGLTEAQRAVFVGRYFRLDPIDVLARRVGWSHTRVTTTLHRLRVRLKEFLTKEGFDL